MKNLNTVSMHRLVLSVLVFVLLAMNEPVEAGKEFKVGDAEGWRVPDEKQAAFYKQWAAKVEFRVGDSLREFLDFCFRVFV